MYPFPYPVPYRPMDEQRQRERHARNIGQIEGYGAAIRDMRGARRLEKVEPLLEQKVSAKEDSKKVESKKEEIKKEKTVSSKPKVTQDAYEKYKEHKKTKEATKKEATATKAKTADAFEKYEQYRNKHYEYRGLLEKGAEGSKKVEPKYEAPKHKASKELTHGVWDFIKKPTQPKDSHDVRRARAERQRERDAYYEQKRQESDRQAAARERERERRNRLVVEQAFESWDRKRPDLPEDQRRWYRVEEGRYVRPGRRALARYPGEGRQIWWDERR